MSIFQSYWKEGPGVEKDAPRKRGLALFCEIFLREAWSLIELNLIFVLFSLPVVTIGPALGAMTTVTMRMVRDKNSYVWKDFVAAFRQQFRRFFLAGLLGAVLAVMVAVTVLIYLPQLSGGAAYVLPFAVAVLLCVVGGLTWIYVFPLAAVTDLPLGVVVKNSLLLGLGCLRHSVPGLVVCTILVGPTILFFPQSVPVALFISFSLANFVASFAAWSDIRRYVAEPAEGERELEDETMLEK